jgi:hypothetical protein
MLKGTRETTHRARNDPNQYELTTMPEAAMLVGLIMGFQNGCIWAKPEKKYGGYRTGYLNP